MESINKEKLVEKLTNIADGFRTSRSLTETLSLDDMATLAAVPIGSGENKLAQLVDGTITEITAEDLEGITEIREKAFYSCTALAYITIPNTVTSIGNETFYKSSNLKSIEILSNSITSIPQYFCYNCGSLNSVNIPDSVTKIGMYAFNSCSKLSNITIPANVTKIETYGLGCGSYFDKVTFTFLGTTPPTLQSTSSLTNLTSLNKIIVPVGSGEAYRTATNWTNFADYIEEAAV